MGGLVPARVGQVPGRRGGHGAERVWYGPAAPLLRFGCQDRQPGQRSGKAARLEVEWWRLHRVHQYRGPVDVSQLEGALVALYSYVYGVESSTMRDAARWRVRAMDVSDQWVAARRALNDPLLLQERRSLVASYGALRDAVAGAG
jgi:hypothetical protein